VEFERESFGVEIPLAAWNCVAVPTNWSVVGRDWSAITDLLIVWDLGFGTMVHCRVALEKVTRPAVTLSCTNAKNQKLSWLEP
jgi:hypothetical protein